MTSWFPREGARLKFGMGVRRRRLRLTFGIFGGVSLRVGVSKSGCLEKNGKSLKRIEWVWSRLHPGTICI